MLWSYMLAISSALTPSYECGQHLGMTYFFPSYTLPSPAPSLFCSYLPVSRCALVSLPTLTALTKSPLSLPQSLWWPILMNGRAACGAEGGWKEGAGSVVSRRHQKGDRFQLVTVWGHVPKAAVLWRFACENLLPKTSAFIYFLHLLSPLSAIFLPAGSLITPLSRCWDFLPAERQGNWNEII